MNNIDGKALYYPYIYIQNLDWLKTSLFYWDEIYRIIPSVYLTEDAADVKKVVESEILRSAYPDAHHRERAKTFLYQKIPYLLRQYEQRGISIKKCIEYELEKTKSTTERLINIQKIDSNLVRDLIDCGLAEFRDEDRGFLRVDNYVGGLYMTYLANVMSEPSLTQPGLNVFSDSPGFTLAGGFTGNDTPNVNLAESLDPLRFSLSLNIGLPSPIALRKMPMEKIIELNRTLIEERRAFRAAVNEYQREISSIISQGNDRDVEDALLELSSTIQRDIKFYHLLSARVLGIPVHSLFKNCVRISLLFLARQAIEGEDISSLYKSIGYLAGSEFINLSFRKLPFLPSDRNADIAKYLLPVERNCKQFYPDIK